MVGVKRVGHGGTLDPLATGVLPVLIGGATRFAERLREAPKVYDGLVRFGVETATDDREGRTIRTAALPSFDLATVEASLAPFRGTIRQTPPAYSALKVAGRPAYARARAGEQLTLPAREVQVYRLDVIAADPPDLRVLVVCSSGTYVRSLARDLGGALGSAAHLAGLRRVAVGALEARAATAATELRPLGRHALAARLRPAGDDVLALDPAFLREPAATIATRGTPVR